MLMTLLPIAVGIVGALNAAQSWHGMLGAEDQLFGALFSGCFSIHSRVWLVRQGTRWMAGVAGRRRR